MMAAMNVTSRNKAMMSSTLANYIPSAHFSGLALVSALSPLAFKRHARHLEFFLIIFFRIGENRLHHNFHTRP